MEQMGTPWRRPEMPGVTVSKRGKVRKRPLMMDSPRAAGSHVCGTAGLHEAGWGAQKDGSSRRRACRGLWEGRPPDARQRIRA